MKKAFNRHYVGLRKCVYIAALLGLSLTVVTLSTFSYKTTKTEWIQFYNNGPQSSASLNVVKSHHQQKHQWIIIMTLNAGYIEFFLNWLAAFKKCNLTIPITLVAEDKELFVKVQDLKLEGVTVKSSELDEINGTVVFGSKTFNDMSVRRHTYILDHLNSGQNIIFSDTDTVWLKDPTSYFTGNYDIWMQLDDTGIYCPGTMAIKSNKATLKFFADVVKGLKRDPQADQPYLNRLIHKSRNTIRVQGLPINSFPSGKQYFKNYTDEQRSKVVVVHNNWIRTYKSKLLRFKKFKLWFLNSTSF